MTNENPRGLPVAWADPQAFANFKSNGHKGGVYAREWMWANPDTGLVPLVLATDYAAIVAERDGLAEDARLLAASLAGAFAAMDMQPTPASAPLLEKYRAPEPEPERYVCLKASGSRFAYVNDTHERRTVKRYDILRRYGGMDGWTCATEHANSLNAADRALDQEGKRDE